jgi:hypothetical protein
MGMAINLLVTAVVLAIGLQQRLPGLPTAAAALNIAAFVEIIYLTWRTQRALPHGLSQLGQPGSRCRARPLRRLLIVNY